LQSRYLDQGTVEINSQQTASMVAIKLWQYHQSSGEEDAGSMYEYDEG